MRRSILASTLSIPHNGAFFFHWGDALMQVIILANLQYQ